MPYSKSKQAQQAIAKYINQRGYGPGDLSSDQYVAKQLAIALQELVEAMHMFGWPARDMPDEVRALFEPEVKDKLKDWFHDVDYFKRVEFSYSYRPFLDEEIADAAIPLLNVAEQSLGIDLIELCLYKAKNDIKRGVG